MPVDAGEHDRFMASVGRSRVVGTLGTGGMGEVYRALDTRLKREVALEGLTTT